MKRAGLLILPAGVGLLAALLWQQGWWANPIVYARLDVGSLLFALGLGITLVWGTAWLIWYSAWKRNETSLTRKGDEQTALHRRFIRRLDHEMKNRLTAIRAALINLSPDSNSKVVGEVRSEVDRLATLGTDLRKLTDLETRSIEQEPVDLTELLTELIDQMQQRPEAATRQIHLALPHVPWPLSPVCGDRDLIFLALHNVIDNALKFCRLGDTIEIRTFEDGPSIVVEVADTGPGIHPEDLPHLGEELFRGRTTQEVNGSGLGLALVQTIIERHSGTMKVRSRLGQGTIVTVRFPVVRT